MRHSEHPGARRPRLARLLARLRQRQQARHDAEQSLASILEAGGNQPLPPTRTERILQAGSEVVKDQVAHNPHARRLADAARRHVEEAEAPARPGPVDRALQGPRQVLNSLVSGEAESEPRGLPGAAARPALAGPPVHAGHAASVVATRYGTHALVLAVVLLVIFAGGAPALHARASEAHKVYGPNDGLTEPAGALLPPTTANSPSGDFLVNPALPITRMPNRVQTYTAQAGDTPATVAARFNLAVGTVLQANGLVDPDLPLDAGKNLVILPFDGTYHIVSSADTLVSIAQRYQVEPNAITEYKPNRLDPPYTLTPGQALIVPGGAPPPRDATIVYRTRGGATLDSVANKFGINGDTILAANPDVHPDAPLAVGVDLRILPVPGVEVTVQDGDTVDGLAEKYGTDPGAITGFAPNHLLGAATLQPGATLILPGGVPPQPETAAAVGEAAPAAPAAPAAVALAVPPANAPKVTSRGPVRPPSAGASAPKPPAAPPATKKSGSGSSSSSGASSHGTGRFMWPVSGIITQYFWGRHNGLDIATRAGTPLHAADSGEVVQAGWRRDGLGYAVQIDHHNGYVTLYGHMIRQPAVQVGQYVARGQVIGYIGSTGRSTGPHVHFIICTPGSRYYNPLNFLP